MGFLRRALFVILLVPALTGIALWWVLTGRGGTQAADAFLDWGCQ